MVGTGGGAPNLIPPSLAIRAAIAERLVASSSSFVAPAAPEGSGSSDVGAGGTVRLGDMGGLCGIGERALTGDETGMVVSCYYP